MNTSAPTTPPLWLAPRSHSHLLSALLVTLNILLVFFLFFYFYRFFWQNQPSNQNDETNSTSSSPPSSPRPGRGLELQFISSLPVIEFKNGGTEKVECAVCLGEFKDGEKIRVLPKCNHRFHVECVDKWFKTNANCPLCRAPVESRDCTALDSVV
ncbi:hypothetical protein LUZ60_003532 [Juncus effusus]|nr:hypothetical protein LUZ60_003532 [Juncus effusus]